MIEVLVTLIILLVGLLGLAALHIQAQRSQMESYQRVQALMLLDDMVGRINANRSAASCYAFITNGMAIPFLGTGFTPPVPACSTGSGPAYDFARQDLTDWDALLKGASETSGGLVGAMIGARGCVSLVDAATQTYRVSVAWQGLGDTSDPSTLNASLTCAAGEYGGAVGTEPKRREVTVTLRIATLG